MEVHSLHPRRLRDYTSIPFEIFIAVFSALPFFLLAYFYPVLPPRVPLFMSLNGEVAVWAEKSLMSVLRVPLMAVDTQLICLLAKYGLVKSETTSSPDDSQGRREYQERYVGLGAGIWDWLRCLVAVKMSAASLDTIFLTLEGLKFLSRPAFGITAIAALLAVAGGVFYGWRLLVLKRELKEGVGGVEIRRPVDARYVYGGVLYIKPSDPALFVRKYIFNLGNKWAWLFIACVVAYPLLVFSADVAPSER